MTDCGASSLSDVTSSLIAAVSSGEFLQTLIEEAAAAGGSAAMAFMTIDVDVEASTQKEPAGVGGPKSGRLAALRPSDSKKIISTSARRMSPGLRTRSGLCTATLIPAPHLGRAHVSCVPVC